MTAYYNEWEPYAAAWLRNLIIEGLIPYGHVDTRSIVDVDPRDLAGYAQCHFFAGLGGWALAGRLAGLPDDFPWWSGSCPCQPFSVAGRGEGQADERHLWPAFARLIGECRPPVVFGEQVAAAAKGRNISGKDLQRLRHSQALLSVLDKQQGSHAKLLRRMLECAGEVSEDWYESAAIGDFQDLEKEEHCGDYDSRCEMEGSPERFALQLGQLEAAVGRAVRSRSLRDDGDTIQPGWRPNMGQPFVGPDNTGGRLRNSECPSGDIRLERDDELLGCRNGSRRDGCASPSDGRHASDETGKGPEEAPERSWLDGVCADLEGLGYAVGAAALPACAVGAPHRRDRLWFVAERALADNDSEPSELRVSNERSAAGRNGSSPLGGRGAAIALADAGCLDRRPSAVRGSAGSGAEGAGRAGELCDGALGDADKRGRSARVDVSSARHRDAASADGRSSALGDADSPRPPLGDGEPGNARPECAPALGAAWRGSVWLRGADGKARRVEPSIRLLAHGISGRVAVHRTDEQGGTEVRWVNRIGALKAYGNAIVPQVAAEFIGAYAESRGLSFGD